MPVLGVLAAHAFSGDAWSVAKQRGLLAINLRQLYGDAALDMLAKLECLHRLANAGGRFGEHTAEIDYEGLANDVDELHTHPYVAALRSLAFEVVTAALLGAKGWVGVELSRQVPFQNTTRDVDVVGKRDGEEEICLVECKAEHGTKELKPEYVRKFFTETVPAALKYFTNVKKCNVKKCQAEIWTTGLVGERAQAELANLRLPKRVDAQLLEKADIISLVPAVLSPCKRLIETLSRPKGRR